MEKILTGPAWTKIGFEWSRKTLGFWLGPAFFVLTLCLPLEGLSPQARRLAAVTAWVVVWWVCEPIPLAATALLAAVLNAVLGVASAAQVLSDFAHPILFLFIGSFMLARAMALHGLDRRFAYFILSFSWVRKSPARILAAFGLASAALSMWISNTACAAIFLPIALGVLKSMDELSAAGANPVRWMESPFATGLLLTVAYASAAGGLATPVGTPPNLIGIGMLEKMKGVHIGFLQWSAAGVPIAAGFLCLLLPLIVLLHPAPRVSFEAMAGYFAKLRLESGAMSRGERNVLFAFGLTVFLWLLPSACRWILGADHPWTRLLAGRLDEGIVAMLGAMLLFALPVSWSERRFTLDWSQAVRIDWGTILLFGGGLSLGKLMFDTGLARWIAQGMSGLTGASSLWGVTALGALMAGLLSETTSNTAGANMTVPIIIVLADEAGVSPLIPVVATSLSCSFAFMFPVSTPPNAVVYGSGKIPITSMIRAGTALHLLGFAWLMGALWLLAQLGVLPANVL
ncbi:MAG: DASS family sodium-coupled anion symporter [Elusimicrobia bacterium]|nr:DASS family sodium-coupled anion symporter [Elusimicrobiota bacterium]